MSDVVSLNEARATKEGDCKLWTVADALRAALREIDAGNIQPTMVYVAMYVPNDPEGARYHSFAAGGDEMTITGLVAQHFGRRVSPD
jgi:hypothetical protein